MCGADNDRGHGQASFLGCFFEQIVDSVFDSKAKKSLGFAQKTCVFPLENSPKTKVDRRDSLRANLIHELLEAFLISGNKLNHVL